MIKKWTTAVLSMLAISASAHAEIGLKPEALAGLRWGRVQNAEGVKVEEGQKKDHFFAGQEFRVGAAYAIPQIPVSAGLNLGVINYNPNFDSMKGKSAYEFNTALEAKAWVPAEVLPTRDLVIPYVKLAYTPFSMFRAEAKLPEGSTEKEGKQTVGSNNGFSVGVGTNIKIVEQVSASVEYSFAHKTFAVKEKGSKEKEVKAVNNSHGALIGIVAHL